MKFYTDHYFQIGHTHYISGKPCQDFAISSSNDDVACAVISDGCSTSGNTDIGARLISTITLNYLLNKFPIEENIHYYAYEINLRQISELEKIKQLLDLADNDLLATSAFIYITKSHLLINVHGDGVIAIVYNDDKISLTKLNWSNNMPHYPIYNNPEIGFNFPYGSTLTQTDQFNNTIELQLNRVNHIYCLHSLDDAISKINYVALFTDGVCQIDQVDWRDATLKFLNFKSLTGDFLKRRMIKQIKEYQKIGKGPLDDIAGTIIRIEHEE